MSSLTIHSYYYKFVYILYILVIIFIIFMCLFHLRVLLYPVDVLIGASSGLLISFTEAVLR
jgi:hypothetical protein